MGEMKILNFLRKNYGVWLRILFYLWFFFGGFCQVTGLRPLRERYRSWGDEEPSEGLWRLLDSKNSSPLFPDFKKSNGNSILELISTPTKITGVHYVQGVIIFHDVFDNEHGGAQIRVEGVYVWPFRQLRMVARSSKEASWWQDIDSVTKSLSFAWNFSHLRFQESLRDKIWKQKHSPIYEMEKHCNVEIAAQIYRVSSSTNDGDQDHYHLEGLMESPSVDDDGDCFSPMLLNATSINIEVYYNKAVNYTLMVTFVSFLQVLLLIRQNGNIAIPNQ
ncbi:Transmembrane E3 ubiquitin-protein ligase fly2 [Datura stramonium]|uniref:Transmembrane E3 ubiquitin-protein ligase fly2 n=1 Tax=Datura stramonium TaxID=4076 RepID=A0ABS8T7F0_DATST|nr:Transmembrane E3 ubiquitin-protein ligase fly2 [Datura stramonium]